MTGGYANGEHMHCVNCGYLLFNLTRPVCPECGRAFCVSDYRFEPGSVEFVCPSCLTPLEGGLPTPDLAGRPCPHCGTPLDPDMLSVRPRRPDAVGLLHDPWDDPGLSPGSLPTLWPVWKRVMALDGDVFRDRAIRSSGDAYWFAGSCFFVAAVAGCVLAALLEFFLGRPEAIVGSFVAVFVGFAAAILAPLVLAGGPAIWAHLALCLLEPNYRPFHHTFRTACYAMAPVVLGGVPIAGAFVGGPYVMVAFIVGIRAVHETSAPVAIVSALWLPAVLAAMLVLL